MLSAYLIYVPHWIKGFNNQILLIAHKQKFKSFSTKSYFQSIILKKCFSITISQFHPPHSLLFLFYLYSTVILYKPPHSDFQTSMTYLVSKTEQMLLFRPRSKRPAKELLNILSTAKIYCPFSIVNWMSSETSFILFNTC